MQLQKQHARQSAARGQQRRAQTVVAHAVQRPSAAFAPESRQIAQPSPVQGCVQQRPRSSRRAAVRVCAQAAGSAASPSGVVDVVIVGGGLSGLVAGQALAAKHGVSNFLVTEARERVGGNITSMEGNGYVWEEGPNSFQPNDAMLQIAVRRRAPRILTISSSLQLFSLTSRRYSCCCVRLATCACACVDAGGLWLREGPGLWRPAGAPLCVVGEEAQAGALGPRRAHL